VDLIREGLNWLVPDGGHSLKQADWGWKLAVLLRRPIAPVFAALSKVDGIAGIDAPAKFVAQPPALS